VNKEQNGRKSLRRPKPTVGCNASKRRRSDTAQFILQITFISNCSLYMNRLLLVYGQCIEATTLQSNVVHIGENEFYRTVCRSHVLEELLIGRRWAGVEESTSIQLSIRVPLSFALLSISAVSTAE